jgi:hypothetical protein
MGSITDVQQAQSVNIQVDDGIQVVKLEEQDEQSYSVLDFSDYLEVELFSDTSVFLADLRQDTGDATQVTLHIDRGNLFVHQNEQKTSQVTVQTLFTTIKTLTSGTEFDVCHNEELTCVLVKKGVVEVTAAKGRKFIVKAGEAGYVLKDESPSATRCAPTAVFIVWEERFRLFADAPALDQELSLLPQKPCPVNSADLPINARILYRDEFRNPSNGWVQGEIDNFMVSYFRLEGRRNYRYYQVQVQGPNDQYLAFIPNEREYSNVNVDIKAFSEAPSSGDFRYGMIFRRSGDQYYAFVISPLTKSWYFLKSSSAGLESLSEGIDERMRALEARDTLRVESYESTFLLFINGRFIDLVSDPDYASGEVGLFVETMDNPDALIRFDSLMIWNVPPVILIPDTGGREYCFNIFDDDGDRLIDRVDPDCQRLGLTSTSLPQPTDTSIAPETSTPQPTNTSIVPKTFTSQPTRTLIPPRTSTPQPTRTFRPQPTRTLIPPRTSTPQPTRTFRPQPTRTLIPPRTSTPQPTRTLVPQPTRTLIPPRTSTPQPTNPPPPTATDPPPPTDPPTPEPLPTEPPIP